jgi:hypothetical protein
MSYSGPHVTECVNLTQTRKSNRTGCEAVRVLNKAVRVLNKAVRVLNKAVCVLNKAARVLNQAVRVLIQQHPTSGNECIFLCIINLGTRWRGAGPRSGRLLPE